MKEIETFDEFKEMVEKLVNEMKQLNAKSEVLKKEINKEINKLNKTECFLNMKTGERF